ncbi:glutathione S-transferase, partial [uncultured Acinetobacter sp.]
MITLHHLDQSRSFRILWLLEEIKQPYELKRYYRDSSTHLAPDSLKTIHPLGKSPVLEWDGKVIAESGAIVELLIQKLAPHLAPDMDEPTYVDYLQWIHFSESSAMLPFLLKTFNAIETKQGTKLVFLENYTQVEFDKVFSYLNEYLKDKEFLVADRLTGADFMMGFG